MSAPEFLWIVKESAYGTPMASPVAGTDSVYVRLADSNSFGMVADPIFNETPYGGGLDTCADVTVDHFDVKGSLSTLLYPSQAALLLSWALTPINTGQTSPWTTTEPAQDLASCTVYHGIRRRDGTIKRHKYTGVKVAAATIACSRQAPRATLQLDLVASKEVGNPVDSSSDPTGTEFPEPADTAYPVGPYVFSNTAGLFKVGSFLSQYSDISFKVQNKLDPQWYENHWVSTCGYKGRAVTLDATVLLKASPDLRSGYLSLANQDVEVTFSDGVSGHTATKLDFNLKNYIARVPYDLPLGGEFWQKLSIKNRYDPANGDFALTVSTNP